ncbi:MAG: hypothetical protein ABJF86_14680 [Tateyamaria sp.]|uniref:hypothetical protein n=1 Tax=Tateyamaria sp. TaxID=1929288 RepID=UPI003293DAC8
MRFLASLFAICASAVSAQSIISQSQGDPALVAALYQPGLIVDRVVTWPLDWDRQAPMDLLVQTSYANASGGNATFLEFRIATPSPLGPILGDTFILPGNGIKEVQSHPQGAFLIQYQYRDGDSRCCPSGSVTTILDRGIP